MAYGNIVKTTLRYSVNGRPRRLVMRHRRAVARKHKRTEGLNIIISYLKQKKFDYRIGPVFEARFEINPGAGFECV